MANCWNTSLDSGLMNSTGDRFRGTFHLGRHASAIPVIVAGDLNLDALKPGISHRLNRAGFRFCGANHSCAHNPWASFA